MARTGQNAIILNVNSDGSKPPVCPPVSPPLGCFAARRAVLILTGKKYLT